MVIVDTSVWVDFFQGTSSKEAQLLEDKLTTHDSLCINGLIEMELLQGARTDLQARRLKEYLAPFQYFPMVTQSHFDQSIVIYRKCRSKGVTIRKSIDCLIAATALVEGLSILHKDRDFSLMASAFPKLRILQM